MSIIGVVSAVLSACIGMASCSSGASHAERRACAAAERITSAEDRATLDETLADVVEASIEAENRALVDAARDFRTAVDERRQADAADAIGAFFSECERLGLETPGAPA